MTDAEALVLAVVVGVWWFFLALIMASILAGTRLGGHVDRFYDRVFVRPIVHLWESLRSRLSTPPSDTHKEEPWRIHH